MPREVIGGIGTFSEMTIHPGWTTKDTVHSKVDLSVELAPGVMLDKPFIAAAMSSVVGPEMMDACAKNGMMAVAPSSVPIEYASEMISRVKRQEVRKGDLEIVGDPELVRTKRKVGDAVDLYKRSGHSVIPVCDSFRKLNGLFVYDQEIPEDLSGMNLSQAIDMAKRESELSSTFRPFDMKKARMGVDYMLEGNSHGRIQRALREGGRRYMPIIDRSGVLKGLAFIYKYNGYACGGAIHTYKWEKRAEALAEAGADAFFIDSSDGASDFQVETIRGLKKAYPKIPVCAGNVVASRALKKTRSGDIVVVPVYDTLVDAGADIIKIGMGSGQICVTTDNRGVGRNLLKALNDLYEARETSKAGYRPFIADGGVGTFDPDYNKRTRIRKNMRHDSRSIDLVLAFAELAMMGSYPNMCEEAAGQACYFEGVRYNETWGEGSLKAQSLVRYGVKGEGIKRPHIEEGVANYVPCVGLLKPCVENTALQVAMTLSNAGAANLSDYRRMAVLERFA
jgi:IMP dehydrogenase